YSLFCLISLSGQYHKRVIGAPVSPEPISYVTARGDTLQLFPSGDNISNYLLTDEGLPVIRQGNQYHYALFKNGNWESDNREIGIAGQLSTKQQKKYRQALQQMQAAEQAFYPQLKAIHLEAPVPSTGDINVLLILVEFSDKAHTRSKEEIKTLFNEPGNEVRAGFKTFYQQASHGKLNVNIDVAGWYNCNQAFSDFSDSKGMYLTGNLIRKAVDLAEADGVDFSGYDNDGDGKVDAVMVMHAGLGADHRSETKYIWPHSWSLSGTVNKAVTYDGVRIDHYVTACEMRQYDGQMKGAGIGTFAHEFGHALGLPDLYDGTGKSSGLGHWAIMSAGSWLDRGYHPGNFCAWSRVELGWETPQVFTASDYGDYELKAATSIADQVVQIETNDPAEYFLLENRQKEFNDKKQPTAGLAVYHINRDKIKKDRGVNDDRDLPGIRLLEADFSISAGLYGGDDRGSYRDLFPGPSNSTTLGAFTTPDTKLFNGGFSGVELAQINHQDGLVSFSLVAPKPTLNWVNTNLFESYLNDGSLRNTIEIQLNNASFAMENGVLPAEALRVANLPEGLTVKVKVENSSIVEIMMEGKATNHESGDAVHNLQLAFTDAAFSNVSANDVYQVAQDEIHLLWYDTEAGVRFFMEDFETCAPPAFPQGWEVKNGSNGTTSQWQTCVGNNHTELGRYGVQFYDKNSQKEEFWLISPAIDLTGFQDIKFSFWEKYDLNGEAKNKVAISTDKLNWHTLYDNHPEKNDSWEEAVAAIPEAYEGETVYLGFCMYDTHAWGWFWDDVALYNEGISAVIELESDPEVQMVYDTDLQRLFLQTTTPMQSVDIIDMNGSVVLQSKQQEIVLNYLSNGIYVVLVKLQNNSYKVIKFRK
ncbi:MAG: M6 family metalloprotease domain-containing protein, partial [Marinilabiliaceae bacterium]|nr:M6 family metalloprotease domain-containing protein [Marinilabiliaceae bacterium]